MYIVVFSRSPVMIIYRKHFFKITYFSRSKVASGPFRGERRVVSGGGERGGGCGGRGGRGGAGRRALLGASQAAAPARALLAPARAAPTRQGTTSLPYLFTLCLSDLVVS